MLKTLPLHFSYAPIYIVLRIWKDRLRLRACRSFDTSIGFRNPAQYKSRQFYTKECDTTVSF
ncbi:hypothetical protein HMPREF9554_03100 [Treponema phagedenis F0421]|nr:hypothetical protein HMPREF9554_03100 [Treponema phagedenis F0421]